MKRILLSATFLLLSAGAFAQDIFFEQRNILIDNTTRQITFDLYISGSANYVTNETANFDNGLQNADAAFDIDFGTDGSTGPVTPTSVAVVKNSGVIQNGTGTTSLGGNGPVGYDTKFKVSITRSSPGSSPITLVPTNIATVTITFPAGVTIGSPANGAAISLRTITGGTGSKWSNFLGLTGQPVGTSRAATPLPVKLIAFLAAKTSDSRVQLNWSTANEQNCEGFDIERSADGHTFSDVVAVMKAAGDSKAELNYQTYDQTPLTGNNFYRLKMMDNNGIAAYSDIRRVNFARGKVMVFPTDSRDGVIHVALPEDYNTATIALVDAVGRLLPVAITKEESRYKISLRGLAPGNYLVVVDPKDQRETFKITYRP